MSNPNNPKLFIDFHAASGDHVGTDITLRDLFAGMAMQGMLAAMPRGITETGFSDSLGGAALKAYRTADALLGARDA